MKNYSVDYLNPKWVFAIDLLLSVAASFVTFLVVNYITENGDPLFSSKVFGSVWLLSAVVGTFISMLVTGGYNIIIRYSSFRDLIRLSFTALIKMALMGAVLLSVFGFTKGIILAVSGDALLTLAAFMAVRMLMLLVYDIYKSKTREILERKRVLVYGTSEKSVSVLTRLKDSPHYSIIGFVADSVVPSHIRLSELPVFNSSGIEDLKRIADNYSVRTLLFASERDAQSNRKLINDCALNGIKTLIVPSVEEFMSGGITRKKVRSIKIEDLLGREEIEIPKEEIVSNFKGKTVMVTGAAGSIGSELCRQLIGLGIGRLILFDNAETPMHNLRLDLEERYPGLEFIPVIGDVRQLPRLDFAFREYKPQIVFHAAAYKHVPLMEENPCEAVLVNVCGSRNVADKCVEYGVESMVMISTDKAVNPTNVMGCTKRLAEIYVQSLGLAIEQGKHKGNTRFVTTRFGNVLGSSGSVIPRFREEIEAGGPVTVTHLEITRFFMTVQEACRLVMEASSMCVSNRIFAFDMGEPVKIDTLARNMIELAGLRVNQDIKIVYTGLRSGEKLYEEVLSNKECTEPTSNDRIRIAKVREYGYEEILKVLNTLEKLSYDVNILDMVKLMKETVPEFKSNNSRFTSLD